MKTLDELREDFEGVFMIKMMLHQLHGKIVFVELINDYKSIVTNQGDLTDKELEGVAWVKGSWFMFQELNKND